MTERERRIYCTQCGSIVNAADKFCGVCGAAISPRATDAAPTQQIPTQVPPPPAALAPSRNLTPIIVLGFAVALVLVLTIGSVAGLAILRGTAETSEPASKQGNAAAGAADATRPTKATESTATKPADDESEVKKPN